MVVAEELYFFNNLNVIENREPIKIFSLLKLILFLKNTGVLWHSCQIFLSNICYIIFTLFKDQLSKYGNCGVKHDEGS